MATAAEFQAIRSDLLAALRRVDALIDASVPADEAWDADITGFERTKAIEWVLGERGRVMRPVEIWAELNRLGRSDPKMEVQVTTFDLWKRGRISKVARGQYVTKSASA